MKKIRKKIDNKTKDGFTKFRKKNMLCTIHRHLMCVWYYDTIRMSF